MRLSAEYFKKPVDPHEIYLYELVEYFEPPFFDIMRIHSSPLE
jgi:hypothetical protein